MPPALAHTRRRLLLAALDRAGEAHVDDLASELGVSPITVRRDIARLADEGLLERVRGGAQSLAGGREEFAAADRVVGADRSGARPNIAMVVPSLQYYWPAIVHGATEAARRLGAELAVHASTANAEANLLVLEQIAQDPSLDALIIAPELRSGAASDALVARLVELPIPVVLAERGIDDCTAIDRTFDTVRSNHSAGAALAVRHLASLGHRRIAYEGVLSTPTNPFVETGYERTIAQLGLQGEAAPARRLDLSGERTFYSIDAALERYRDEHVTAVLIHSDVAATMLLQHATRRGWSVPEELSLIAYDDELSVSSRPALTAVAPPKRALGERAVQLALHRMESPDSPIEHVRLMPSLHVRESTRAVN
ncbi:substrate-binding domain-containing protein [Brachybacterium tyrofermentans]|uniref:substrate-binding domain-containing protein n=1 Tax=Brachybacterium tyrofermentans TaxID=47848 RepID=UPI003FCFD5EE